MGEGPVPEVKSIFRLESWVKREWAVVLFLRFEKGVVLAFMTMRMRIRKLCGDLLRKGFLVGLLGLLAVC